MDSRNSRTIFACILIGAIFMSGFACGRYMQYSEKNRDIEENFGDETEQLRDESNCEIEDGKEINESSFEEEIDENSSDIITFCVMGKETLEINKDRFTDTGRVDNLWELDEINKIFDSLQGEWEIDQYFDFVYWRIYEPNLFDFHDNIEEETRQSLLEAYYEKVEAAEENIPDISFSIRNSEGEERNENYIYQQTYSSPVSIIMSKDRSSEFYPIFKDSCAIPKEEDIEYPVLYIKFMRYQFEEELYKPATLVITADGGFYILIDGAYYSLKEKEG
ncbi:MAG: hypothetical protein HDQ96_05410 [Lachnospiraceae bacterium]|nr:hypothetical protein [Lachnospiraceae bacterium]